MGNKAEKDETEKLSDKTVSEIDNAIAAAKARKAMKQGKPAEAGDSQATSATSNDEGPKRKKLTDEERKEREAQREKDRAERKAKRDAEREQKLKEREAQRQPAHMKKVMKAAEKLGALGQAAQILFNEATTNLTAAELAVLALHIQHFNRVKATERALEQKLEPGQRVVIVGGDPRFIGKVGTLDKVQRIRCYVDVEGMSKPVYLFTSEVRHAPAEDAAKTEDAPASDEQALTQAATA